MLINFLLNQYIPGKCISVSRKQNLLRVATVREKVLESKKNSRSGNYIFSQGNLKKK